MEKTICELFAGVGGFRLGFERLHSGWETVWFSQWEPGAKTQWAHACYVSHFGLPPVHIFSRAATDVDIATVDKKDIPSHTLLVGGFPCQDYSVAQSLASSRGIEGKKGVLWWQIRDTLIAKKPPFCLLENVDRLLKSPAKQRGRDFGVILACLHELGYNAEWRVINAADYGAASRRKRIFIFAWSKETGFASSLQKKTPEDIIQSEGMMAKAFPVRSISSLISVKLPSDILTVSDSFQFEFKPAGILSDDMIYTADVEEITETPILLGMVLQKTAEERYFIGEGAALEKWTWLKGAKKIPRKAANGHEYIFSEGPIAFPDPWDRPGRTMLTSESTLNRSTHVVLDPETRKLRRLTPVEAERLQGFDDGWTDTGMPERMRFFCMGNALVVPMISRMGSVLDTIIDAEP